MEKTGEMEKFLVKLIYSFSPTSPFLLQLVLGI